MAKNKKECPECKGEGEVDIEDGTLLGKVKGKRPDFSVASDEGWSEIREKGRRVIVKFEDSVDVVELKKVLLEIVEALQWKI